MQQITKALQPQTDVMATIGANLAKDLNGAQIIAAAVGKSFSPADKYNDENLKDNGGDIRGKLPKKSS